VCVCVCVCVCVGGWEGGWVGVRGFSESTIHKNTVTGQLLTQRYNCLCVCMYVYIYIYIYADIVTICLYVITNPIGALFPAGKQCAETCTH
jgi:TctA family transporter